MTARLDIDVGCVVLSGVLPIGTVADVPQQPDTGRVRFVDPERVDRMDTAGAWFVLDLAGRMARSGQEPQSTGASDNQSLLLETVRASMPEGGSRRRPALH